MNITYITLRPTLRQRLHEQRMHPSTGECIIECLALLAVAVALWVICPE